MGLEKIGEIRKARKMTLDELSLKSGVPTSTLKKISAGITTNPNLDTVQAIARALNCSLDDFDDNPKIEYNTFLLGGEKEHIKKYRYLPDSGKEMVDFVLDKEYERAVAIQEAASPVEAEPTLSAENARELEFIKQEMLTAEKGTTSSASTSSKLA